MVLDIKALGIKALMVNNRYTLCADRSLLLSFAWYGITMCRGSWKGVWKINYIPIYYTVQIRRIQRVFHIVLYNIKIYFCTFNGRRVFKTRQNTLAAVTHAAS